MVLAGRPPRGASVGLAFLLLISLAAVPAPRAVVQAPGSQYCSPAMRPSAQGQAAILVVRVQDGAGNPVEAAVVRAVGQGLDKSATTSFIGWAILTLVKGSFEVTVTLAGQLVYSGTVDVHGMTKLDVTVGASPPPPPPPPTNDTNQPPQACFTYSPNPAMAEEPITFDASASSDPEGGNLTYAWTFGDGGTAGGVVVNHTYALEGNFTVSLTVADPQGGRATAMATVEALNPHPVQGPTEWNLTVAVRSSNGTPVADGWAEISDSNGSRMAQGNLTGGTYVALLPAGAYQVHAIGEGRDLGTKPVTLDADREVLFILDVVPPGMHSLTVTIKYPDGSPVAGARVEVLNASLATVYQNTSASGEHVVLLPPGNYTVEAWGVQRHFLGAQQVSLDADRTLTFTETHQASPGPWLRMDPASWALVGVGALAAVGASVFVYNRRRLGP